MTTVRALAAGVLAGVIQGRSADAPLAAARVSLSRSDDRGLLGALTKGCLRHYYSNRALARAMLKRPGQKLPPGVEALLMLGIEQLRYTRVPPHAAVAETVSAAREMGLHSATGLINALLRRFIRERDTLIGGLSGQTQAQFEHPEWLIEALRRSWPDHWRDILSENNRPAPMWLRVNLARIGRDEYAAMLAQTDGLVVTPGRYAPSALCIAPARAVTALPGFAHGLVSVQDQSAQLAAGILNPARGERILDACAAPGGKTGHLLEVGKAIDVVAVDCAAERLSRLEENLSRLGLSAQVVAADLTKPGPWQEPVSFDRILLDAPCTGSGVIRRHPDIKVLRRATDSAKLSNLQKSLLASVWRSLKPGGKLLYATCSVLPTENDDVVGSFLTATPDADRILLESSSNWGRATQYGRQVFPGEDASDGFYYAYIAKRS